MMRGSFSALTEFGEVLLEKKPFLLKTPCYDRYPITYRADAPACEGSNVRIFADSTYVFDDETYDMTVAIENHNAEQVAVFGLPISANGKAIPEIEKPEGTVLYYWPISMSEFGPGERGGGGCRVQSDFLKAWGIEGPVTEMEFEFKVCVGCEGLPNPSDVTSFEKLAAAGYELEDLGTLTMTFEVPEN